jgi:hypothetical protein
VGLDVSMYQSSFLTLHDLFFGDCIAMIMKVIVEGREREVNPSWKQISHLL